MLLDLEFEQMLIEMGDATARKKAISEEIENIHTKYGLKPAWYKIRRSNYISKNPTILDKINTWRRK